MSKSGRRRCPFCAEEILAEAILCKHCKTPLTPAAAAALAAAKGPEGSALPVDPVVERLRRFLPERMVESLIAGADSIEEGERRVVTILFADLCGFTQLSETLDAEELAEIVDESYRLMAESVGRYGGAVDKFVGDAVLALFGAPVMHEDDPERAVRAALDLRAAIRALGERRGQALDVRVGINSGEVIVKAFGTESRADYTAIGDAVNLASRLQGVAARGEILVGDSVMRRVQGVMRSTPLSPLTLRGKSKSVSLHRLEGEARTFAKARPSQDIALTPFIGRSVELDVLESLLLRAAKGRGQLAIVQGESGVGKSRLVYEFYHRIAKAKAEWFTGRCTSYGRSVPFQSLSEMLRRVAGIEPDHTPEERRRRIVSLAKRAGGKRCSLEGVAASEIAPAMELALRMEDPANPLLSLDPRERRQRLVRALAWLLRAQAHERPLVLVFEDMHWADELSLDVLNRLAGDLARSRILILLVARPLGVPSLPPGVPATQVSLQELDSRESQALLQKILSTRRLSPEVAKFVWIRSRGNPFFVEELTRVLHEQGLLEERRGVLTATRPLRDTSVPDTLEALIISRLDHLEAQVRRVIQCASVIGQEFRYRLLEHVTRAREELQSALGRLLTGDFILERSTLPELEYLFRNALTQEVTYHTLLRRRRRDFHLRVAQALEQLHADELDEHTELIAHHHFHGGSGVEARDWLRRAIRKCRLLDANLTALEFSENLLTVLRERLATETSTPPEVVETLLEMGRLHSVTGDLAASERNLREAVEEAGRLDLRQAKATGLRVLADILRLRGAPAVAEACLREALILCSRSDAEQRARCRLNLGVLLLARGELARAQREFEQFARWVRQSPGATARDRYIAAANLGLVSHRRGRLDEAACQLEVAHEIAREMGRRREQGEALLNWARVAIDDGDLAGAHGRLRSAQRIAAAIDHGRLDRQVRLALAEVARHRGHLALAAEINGTLLDEAERSGQANLALINRLNLAQLQLEQDHVNEASSSADAALEHLSQMQDPATEAEVCATAAEIAARLGDGKRARSLIRRSLHSLPADGTAPPVPSILRALARALAALGDHQDAAKHLDRALEASRKSGQVREVGWSLAERAQLTSRPKGTSSRDALNEALDIAERTGDRRLRALVESAIRRQGAPVLRTPRRSASNARSQRRESHGN